MTLFVISPKIPLIIRKNTYRNKLTALVEKISTFLLPIKLSSRFFQNFIISNSSFISISAALSSLSSGLNSMSALVLEDYFKPMFKKGLSKRATALIMRGTVVVLGVISVALVYVVENLGPVLQLSMSLPATCVGSLFGVFSIGMFLPWIGKRAAFYGALVAAVLMIYWVACAQIDSTRGLVVFETKPTSVDGCKYNFTIAESSTISTPVDDKREKTHHMSYLYYMPVGAIITCLSAFILSFFFGFEDPSNVDPYLLAPFMRKYFPSNAFERVAEKDNLEELSVDILELKGKQIE